MYKLRVQRLDDMASENSPLLGRSENLQVSDHEQREDINGGISRNGFDMSPEDLKYEGTISRSTSIEPGSLQKISPKFESLDYDIPENSLFLKEQKSFTPEEIIKVDINRWIVMFIIGVITALIAAAIDICIGLLSKWKYDIIKKNVELCTGNYCMAKPYALWVAIDIFFVCIAACLVVYGEPVAAGSGIPQIKCYLNGVKVPHVVRIKVKMGVNVLIKFWHLNCLLIFQIYLLIHQLLLAHLIDNFPLQTLVAKVVGVVFSVSGGLACGKEGPMIHSGAVVAAGVSQGRSTTFNRDFHIFESFRTDHEKRDFVSGGAAAGVAAAFGAPVGGVLFSLEEGASFWNQALTWRMFFGSIISTFTLNLVLSIYKGEAGDLSNPGLINFGTFTGNPYFGYELPLFLIMGVIGGLLGALFNAINHHLTIFRMRFVKRKWLRVVEACIVAALTASSSFVLIYFNKDCNPLGAANVTEGLQFFCQDGEYSSMGTLTFSTPEESIKNLFHLPLGAFNTLSLFLFFCVYFFLSCWTYGLYVPSGLFVPCILIGATWGRMFATLLHSVFPTWSWSTPGRYALIGAAASLGGVVRMTLSLTVILMEATSNITYGLPMMLVLMIAKWVGDFFNEGIYDMHIKLQGVPLMGWDPPIMATGICANNIMSSPVVCFNTVERVGRIFDILKDPSSYHNGFPVVEPTQQFGVFRGIILRSQLIILLKHKVRK
ncbi:predicted protein [Nematostella vectensis]|uniref:Chloride channel protein n=1 Tax=Nematostella vectensis TaxID=45351 RepID=A7SMQ0_NEMVE|nr:predicted protein [Nematostella vectensis]|eukprot:XP_001627108.1 predicted protein [Nematostella vectensis]